MSFSAPGQGMNKLKIPVFQAAAGQIDGHLGGAQCSTAGACQHQPHPGVQLLQNFTKLEITRLQLVCQVSKIRQETNSAQNSLAFASRCHYAHEQYFCFTKFSLTWPSRVTPSVQL